MAEPSHTPEQVIVSGYVPRDLADEFKARAKQDDRSISAQLRRAMRVYLDTEQA